MSSGDVVRLLEDLCFVQTHTVESTGELNRVMFALRNSARTLAATLNHVVCEVNGDGGRVPTMRDGMAEVTAAAKHINDQARTSFAEQHRIVDEASGLIEKMSAGSERTELMVKSAAILSMNTRIEAFRLGAEGRAVKVLADAVSMLEAEVKDVNRIVVELSNQLHISLPKIAATSSNAASFLTSGLDGIDKSMNEVVGRQDDLMNSVRHSTMEGHQHADSIENALGEAIVQTQFSDRVCQVIERVKLRLVEMLETTDPDIAGQWRARLGANSDSPGLTGAVEGELESGEINFL